MSSIKRVAVIGAGPAGAIAVDALAQEKVFDVIRVFERREKAGGCWVEDAQDAQHTLEDLEHIIDRSTDRPLKLPSSLPTYTNKISQPRYTESSIYPHLETNIDNRVMAFSQEEFPAKRTEASIKKHGADTPFRHHTVVQEYIEGLLNRHGYQDFVEYNTTVEDVQKVHGTDEWKVTLRKQGPAKQRDYWWVEHFDAVVVASGHYSVPWVPHINGLADFVKRYPERVEHSKSYRGIEKYRGKRTIVVGASVSGMDIATDLANVAQFPVHAVVRGRWHPYFGEEPFKNPYIKQRPSISQIISTDGRRTVYFEDGTSLDDVDHIIFGTGYSWTLPFLPDLPVRNNRVPGLYLHIFNRQDPTLAFVGAVAAGFTFKVYEWQAVLAARVLAGRAKLPSIQEQEKWEEDRLAKKGDGVPFTALYPDFEEYFELVRKLAGEPSESQPGRRLPKWDPTLEQYFYAGHKLRVAMWENGNKEARKQISGKVSPLAAKL